MNTTETNTPAHSIDHSDAEDERRIDYIVDTRGISYADARDQLAAEKVAATRRSERRTGSSGPRDRTRALSQAAATLFSFDE